VIGPALPAKHSVLPGPEIVFQPEHQKSSANF
jgi:hypothetical protein